MKIRVAGIVDESIVDGPGIRMAVFVQGCSHHCSGCHNPQTWDMDGGTEMDTLDIAVRYLRNPLLDGITLSGGEPFDQAGPCLDLLEKISRARVNVWCYTGYTWDALMARQDPETVELLKHIDILIEGPFVAAEKTLSLPWRGSKNQKLINAREKLKGMES